MNRQKPFFLATALCVLILFSGTACTRSPQSITGTIVDPSGGVVPNANVTIHNPVSGLNGPLLPIARAISISRTYPLTPTTSL